MRRLRIAVLLVLTFTLLSATVESHSVVSSSHLRSMANGVSLHIDYGNGTTTIYEDVTGSNVLEATESVALVQADWTGDIAFVYSINGISSKEETGCWWQYWVNDDFASVAANLYEIQDNDAIIWRFTESKVEHPTSNDNPDQFGSLAIASLGLGSIGVGFLLILYLMTKRN